MPAKRKPAKETDVETEHRLTKAEACKVLQVSPGADEELVTQAYWHHAGKLRIHAARDPEAREQLDQLNRAFLVLNPARTEAPLTNEVEPASEPSMDVAAGFRRFVDQTRARWPERVGEVTTLSVTSALLTFLALSAGAPPLWTLITAGVAALAIWAPWRPASR